MRSSKANSLWGGFIIQIKRWLKPPVFPDDEDKTRKAKLLSLALTNVLVLIPILIVSNFLGNNTSATVIWVDVLAFIACLVFSYWLHQGRIKLPSIGLMALGFVGITAGIISLGTIRAPITATYLLLVITAGLLYELRGMIITTALSSFLVGGLIIAENMNLLPAPNYSVTITQWITYTAIFAWAGSLNFSALQSMNNALDRADNELAERRLAEAELAKHRDRLEDLVKEGTAEVEAKNATLSREIAERKLAEGALREQRDLAENYLNIAEVIIVVLDKHARITLLNRKGHQVLGYDEGELIGKDWIHTCLRPQDHNRVHEVNRKINAGEIEALEYYENYILTKKGEERSIAWHTRILKDENGSIMGTLSSGEDITERKLAEKKMKESEEKYRLLIENSLMGMGLSRGNQVIFANPALLHIFGYDNLDEFLKIPLMDHVAPESRELISTRMREIGEGRSAPPVFEYTILQKDGRTRVLRASSSQITLVGETYTQTTFQDITEQKQAEEALHSSHQILDGIINAIPVRVFWKDRNLVFLGCNAIFARDAGFANPLEIVGKDDYQMVWRDQAELYRADDRQVIESGQPKLLIEEPQTTPEGKTIVLLTSKIPLLNSEGEIAGVIGTYMDITERKETEKALLESENMYRSIFENTGTSTMIIDDNTIVSLANSELEKFTGYSKEEIEGKKSWTEFVSKEDLERMLEQHKLRRTNPSAALNSYEFRAIDRSGNVKDILLRIGMISGTKKSIASLLDITERKHAEEAVRHSERTLREQLNFLQQLIDTIPNPIFYKDTKGVYLGCNIAFEAITGYSKDQIIGHTVYELYPKELADIYREADDKLFQNPGVQMYESSMAHIDGRRHEIMFSKATYFDTEGRLGGLVGVILDITDRKHMEDAVKESERRLADIINFLPDATLVIDSDGKVVAWNHAIEDLTGIKVHDILGKGDYEYSLPFYGERRPILVDLVLEPWAEIEKKYSDLKWADGTLVGYAFTPKLRGVGAYLWGVASPIYDSQGRIVGAIESIKDITEQKRMEKALQESKDYLDKIINSIGDPLFVKDRQHRITLVNDSSCRLFGRSRDEILGKTDSDLFLSKEMAEISWMKDEEAFNKGAEITDEETIAYSTEQALTVLVKKTPYTDNAGKEFLVGIIRDITDRKQAEDRIIASLQEKEVLLKEVHHRVKNNLQVISALLYLQSSNLSDDNIIKIFRDSQDRIKSMALIHENLYRSEDLEKVNFREYINQLISYLSQSYGEISHNISFKVNSDDVLLNINTAIPCGMIINELVSNSLKHAFRDGSGGEVCIYLSSEDGGFKLIVSDNGAGINSDINSKDSKTLGFRLIDTLVKQIDGKMKLDTIDGTRCEICFKGLK